MHPGISLVTAENFAQWQMDIQVLDDNPIYRGKIFRLNFKFNSNYPIEAPEVIFIRAADRGTSHYCPYRCEIFFPKQTLFIQPQLYFCVQTYNSKLEIPMHPHIYSNGIICLDLLSSGNGWSPVQSVESVCMSIQSMLTGNTKNGTFSFLSLSPLMSYL